MSFSHSDYKCLDGEKVSTISVLRPRSKTILWLEAIDPLMALHWLELVPGLGSRVQRILS